MLNFLVIAASMTACASSPGISKLFPIASINQLIEDKLLLDLSANRDKYTPFVNYKEMYGLKNLDAKHDLGYIKGRKHYLFTQVFRPKESKYSIIVVHGFNNHSGYNKKIISWLLKNSFTVITFDLPGHGSKD